MARSSSTNRAAKLAQRSGRARVRFQGGTLFPAIVAMVAVLGLATIVYARQSRPAEDASPPTVDDHWHASYGFYLCDPETGEMEWQQLAGDQDIRDESGQITGQQPGYARTGVHSHNDGVIHWHAFGSAATGRNADLGVFLEVYDVELSDSELKFSDDQVSGATYKEDDTKCGDQDGNLRVQVWNSFQDTGEGRTYTANFNDIRMTNDAMVYTIAFAADDVVLPMPPEAQNLPALGAADSGQTEPPGSVPGSAVPGSTVPVSTPGSATTGSSVPGSTAPGSTAPASSAPRAAGHHRRHHATFGLMQAIVLVGGFGTRLRPLTDTVPKPVLPVGQVPMIVRLVGQLERGGVDQVTLALGFKPEHFNSVFPDQRCGDVAVQYAVEPEPLDTGGAIRFAADVAGIDETFVVANGDVLTDLDLGALVGFHRRSGAEATLHLTPVDDPSVYGVVDADESGRVRRFVEKPTPGTEPCDLVNAGTYVFEPRMLERLPSGVRTSVERQTFPAVVADGALYAMATDDYWIDIGRPDAYLRANLDMLSATSPLSRAEAVDPAARLDQTVTVAHSVIGADVTVGAGTRISGSVLLPGAIVGEQAIIEDSIVMGRIGDGAHVCRVVVGQRGEVAAAAPRRRACAGSRGHGAVTNGRDGDAVADERRRSVAVIGGAGFLGSHLVERLLAEGRGVDVIDDLSTGTLANLAEARRQGGALKIHNSDITSHDGLAVIGMRRPTVIYHLALLGSGRHPLDADVASRSFGSMLAVLEASRHAGSDKVVVALPAGALYGKPSARELPIKELPLEARGLRGVVSKAVIDALAHYRDEYDLEFTALAMSNVYGPRQRADAGVVARFLDAAARGDPAEIEGDGRQTRDFLFIDDATDALFQASDRAGGLVVNVGSGTQTSIRDLWCAIAPDGPDPVRARARPDELARFAVSPVRARIQLSWSPWTTLADGLAETIASLNPPQL